jgi:predicted nucleic acid-binding protein
VGSFRGDRPGEPVAEQFIDQYLDGVSAEWSELDILVSRDARALSWKYKLRGGDAVHLATAVRRRADYFMSIDHAFPFEETVAGVRVMKPGVVWDATLFTQSTFLAAESA